MKKFFAIFNWKMNPSSLEEAIFLASKNDIKSKNVEIVICPPFVFLPEIKKIVKNIKIGAQNCFFENEGSFTGEISPLMLKKLKVDYVILGHSERRIYFGEDNEIIFKKIKAAEANKLQPVLCIGETKEQKEKKLTFKILKKQLQPILKTKKRPIIIAYEPVWAIGGKEAENPKKIYEVKKFIYDFILKYGKIESNQIKILYGGTVNKENIKLIIEKGKVDGVLVGRASLSPEESLKIIKTLSQLNVGTR